MGIFGTWFKRKQPAISEVALVTKDMGVGVNGNGWSLGWGGYQPSSTGTPVSQYTALGSSAWAACIKCISDDTAKIPLKMRKLLSDGGAEPEKKHPIARLLRNPNYFQTPIEFISFLAAGYAQRGNAYAFVRRDPDGMPTELLPLSADHVQIMCNPLDGAISYQATHPRFGAAGRTIICEDMIHIKNSISLDGGLTGVNPIAIGQNIAAIALATQEFAGRVFRQGALLRGILSTDGVLSAEAAKRIGAEWEKTYSGLVSAHKIAVLEQGLRYQGMSMDNEQCELVASREYSTEEIARFMRVPLHKIGAVKTTTSSGLEQLEQQYINDTLMPLARRIEEALESRLLFEDERDKYEIRFDFDSVLRADTKTRFDSYQIALLNGFANIDEVRAKEGDSPLPDKKGQDYRVPMNTASLDSDSTLGMAMANPTPPQPGEGIEQDDDTKAMRPRRRKRSPNGVQRPRLTAAEQRAREEEDQDAE